MVLRRGPNSDQRWPENTSPRLGRSFYFWQVNILRRTSFLYLAHQHISSFSHCQLGGQASIYSLSQWGQD